MGNIQCPAEVRSLPYPSPNHSLHLKARADAGGCLIKYPKPFHGVSWFTLFLSCFVYASPFFGAFGRGNPCHFAHLHPKTEMSWPLEATRTGSASKADRRSKTLAISHSCAVEDGEVVFVSRRDDWHKTFRKTHLNKYGFELNGYG